LLVLGGFTASCFNIWQTELLYSTIPTPTPQRSTHLRPTTTTEQNRTTESSRVRQKKYLGSNPPNSYISKCEPIKARVYEVGRSPDQFARTTKEIAGYIARNVKNGAEFPNAMDPDDLGFEELVMPEEPR
jgi:hypothetical protein